MNREQILAIRPGRCLDALVAQNVMGDTVQPYRHYSTDISAAWNVVKSDKLGHMAMHQHEDDPERFSVFFGSLTNEVWGTAPEAICKAALLATLEVSE